MTQADEPEAKSHNPDGLTHPEQVRQGRHRQDEEKSEAMAKRQEILNYKASGRQTQEAKKGFALEIEMPDNPNQEHERAEQARKLPKVDDLGRLSSVGMTLHIGDNTP